MKPLQSKRWHTFIDEGETYPLESNEAHYTFLDAESDSNIVHYSTSEHAMATTVMEVRSKACEEKAGLELTQRVPS